MCQRIPIESKHNSPEAKKCLHPTLSHVKDQNRTNSNSFCSSDLFRSSTHSLTVPKAKNIYVQNIHVINCLSEKFTWFEASTWMGTVVSKCSIAVCTAQNPHKAHAKSCTTSLISKVVGKNWQNTKTYISVLSIGHVNKIQYDSLAAQATIDDFPVRVLMHDTIAMSANRVCCSWLLRPRTGRNTKQHGDVLSIICIPDPSHSVEETLAKCLETCVYALKNENTVMGGETPLCIYIYICIYRTSKTYHSLVVNCATCSWALAY